MGDSLEVNYKVSRLGKNTTLFLAIAQKKASTKVERGENNGAVLHHVQIVRNAFTIPLSEKEGNLNLPKLENSDKNYELIGFVQKNETGEIIAVAKAILE